MAKKKWNDLQSLGGVVFSTDPNYQPEETQDEATSISPQQQKLRIWLETKHRGGKAASIVAGFVGNKEDLEAIGKQLKNYCGTGGAVKDAEIIIQGDHRDKILQWLIKNGFTQSKKAGG